MARRPVFDKYIGFYFPDVGAASSIYVPVPAAGFVKEVRTAAHGALTTTASVLTVKKGSTDMTNGTITIAAGGAAGDVDSCTPSAGHEVDAGDFITITSDGGAANSVAVSGVIVLRERSKP